MTETTLSLLSIAGLVGIASGADASIWGMYKDAAHEGFRWRVFIRSIVIGCVAAISIQLFINLDLYSPRFILLLFGLSYAAERILVETWKTFVRGEDQSKYTIPMQFALKGRPVKNRGTGSGVLAVLAAVGYERAASENYKTFFFPSRPRGKFAGKPVLHPEMFSRRRYFVPGYVAIRAALIGLVVYAQ